MVYFCFWALIFLFYFYIVVYPVNTESAPLSLCIRNFKHQPYSHGKYEMSNACNKSVVYTQNNIRFDFELFLSPKVPIFCRLRYVTQWKK